MMSIKLSSLVSNPVVEDCSSTKIEVTGILSIFLIINSFTKESGPQGKAVTKIMPSILSL